MLYLHLFILINLKAMFIIGNRFQCGMRYWENSLCCVMRVPTGWLLWGISTPTLDQQVRALDYLDCHLICDLMPTETNYWCYIVLNICR